MGGGDMTPFRMQVLMDVAARVVKLMVTGVWHLSFEEMDMVLALVRHGIDESNERNRKGDSRQMFPFFPWTRQCAWNLTISSRALRTRHGPDS